MARRTQKDYGQEGKLDMTPMIDIVFQLIIFFMLVAELKKTEAEALTLPLAVQAVDDTNPPPDRVTVNVIKTGQARIGGVTYIESDDVTRLQNYLTARAQNHMVSTSPPVSDLPVKIRADAEVEYKYVQRVMVACMRAYIWNVSFGAAPTTSIPF
jgi:biopolymer transport protein ExbD